MNNESKINDLFGLNNTDIDNGLYNKSLMKSEDMYNLVLVFLKKIDYTIDDIKRLMNKQSLGNITFVSLIVFADWIKQSVENLIACYDEKLMQNFSREIWKNSKYLSALRSFIYAHPLNTLYHDKFEFDGKFRCLDIQPDSACLMKPFWDPDNKLYINRNGLYYYEDTDQVDYWMFVYNDEYTDNQYTQYIGISLQSIYDVINDYIDYVYDLNNFLIEHSNWKEQNNGKKI